MFSTTKKLRHCNKLINLNVKLVILIEIFIHTSLNFNVIFGGFVFVAALTLFLKVVFTGELGTLGCEILLGQPLGFGDSLTQLRSLLHLLGNNEHGDCFVKELLRLGFLSTGKWSYGTINLISYHHQGLWHQLLQPMFHGAIFHKNCYCCSYLDGGCVMLTVESSIPFHILYNL